MRNKAVRLAALALVGGLALSGCGHSKSAPKAYHGTDPSVSASPTTNPSKAAASAGAKAKDKAKTKKQTKVANPLAPATIKPVIRNGKRPHPTITAPTAAIDGTVTYTDGVTLEITKVTHGKVTGQGPGIVKGPTTTFALTLDNGSDRTLDLTSVVVTTVYGSPARVSSPVYGTGDKDFGSDVKPGRSASAVYSFMISSAQGSRVTVNVDFDGRHTAAVFSGSTSS